MAKVTNLTLRHKTAYKIYVRNFSKKGTFLGIIPQLDRLKDMGISLLILGPIFQSTDIHAEGECGNPYFVKGFREIDPDYGTKEDFQMLIQAIHDHNMEVLLEIPVPQLAKDSPLVDSHPEYFLHDYKGNVCSRVPGSFLGVDLDFSNPKMWDDLIEILKEWAALVDGFFVRNAQLVRTEFWNSARAEVEDVHPYFYWLSNTLTADTMFLLRMNRIPYYTEGEIYTNFDVLDDQSFLGFYQAYREEKITIEQLAYMLNYEEVTCPSTGVRNTGYEHEDQPRISALLSNKDLLWNWTALSFFKKGMVELLMGQEVGCLSPVPVTKREEIDWTVREDLTEMICRLSEMKEWEICKSGYFFCRSQEPNLLICSYHYYAQHLFGIFNLRPDHQQHTLGIELPQGVYKNLIGEESYTIKEGTLKVGNRAVILNYEGDVSLPH